MHFIDYIHSLLMVRLLLTTQIGTHLVTSITASETKHISEATNFPSIVYVIGNEGGRNGLRVYFLCTYHARGYHCSNRRVDLDQLTG